MSKIKYLILILGVIFGIGLVVPSFASALVTDDICAADPDSALCEENPTDLMTYVGKIVNAMLFVLGTLSVVMIVYAGVTYTTSAGDAKKVEKAKATILYSVVGLVIALLAGAIVNFVLDIF